MGESQLSRNRRDTVHESKKAQRAERETTVRETGNENREIRDKTLHWICPQVEETYELVLECII